jgi:hypothetical protein
MDTLHVYEIRVEGHLADRWSDWFEGLAICNDPDGEVTLTGPLTDQAALFGVLTKIHDLNLILISVYRKSGMRQNELPISNQPVIHRDLTDRDNPH